MLIIYLFLINAVAFLLMLADKQKAKKKKWRISEATLFGSAIIGGSIGALLGMYIFRHKTRNPMFSNGIPAVLLVQIALSILILDIIH